MKMLQAHVDEVMLQMTSMISAYPGAIAALRERGLSDARIAWDILHASRYDTRPLYAYLNDSHIQTVILKAVQS